MAATRAVFPARTGGAVTTRRDLMTGAVAVAGAALARQPANAQEHDQHHSHQALPSDLALRVKALESLLVAKGLEPISKS